MATELAGELLAGRYAYDRELGRGASGRVVRALDRAEGDAVRAIKLVPAEHAAQLRWELGLLSGLAHPGLVRVYELLSVERPVPGFAAPAGGAALVTELAEGEPAGALAARKARDGDALTDLVLRLGPRVASALAALHQRGLVHGDVKPDNLVAEADGSQCKLVDLGLAGPAIGGAGAAGTPGYMAPELLRGERGPAADVYALGVTLHHLLRGAPASDRRTRRPDELLGEALKPFDARPALPTEAPPALARLLGDMLSADPCARPSAREAVARLLPIAEARGLAPEHAVVGGGGDDAPGLAERAAAIQALPLEGRARELKALAAALSSPGIHVVCGPPGSGRSRLVREAVWQLQASRLAAGEAAPTYRVARVLDGDPVAVATVLHVEDADAVDLAEAEATMRGAELEGAPLSLVLERTRPLAQGEADVSLEPMTEGGTRKLLERALPGVRVGQALTREAQRQSGGLPGRLCRLLSAVLAAGEEPSRPEALRDIASLLFAGETELPEGTRALAEVLAPSRSGLSVEACSAALGGEPPAGAATALCAAGLAAMDGGRLRLRPDVREALLAELSDARLEELVARIPQSALDARSRTELQVRIGQPARALAMVLDDLQRLRAQGRAGDAAALARHALASLGDSDGDGALGLALADAERARGRYAQALEPLDLREDATALALRGEILRLQGARAEASACVERAQGDPMAAAVAARLAFDRGELERAHEHAAAAREAGSGQPAALRALEVDVLARLYGGEPAAAAADLTAALAAARAAGDRAAEARLCSIEAQLARSDGDLHGAARSFGRAFELADGVGEQHAAASFLHNVGAQRLDLGQPGPAIAALREAARRLARLGRDADLGRVLYNLGYAAHLIGVEELAADAADRALGASEAAGDPSGCAYALCLQAELALARGERRRAGVVLERLPALEGLPPEEAAIAGARAAAVSIALGALDAAEVQLERATELGGESSGEPVQLELALARLSLSLSRGEREQAAELALRARVQADRVGSFDARLRALLLSARAASGPGEANEHLARVRDLLDTAARGLDPADRARLRAVDAYRSAFEAAPAATSAEPGDARLRRLAGVAKELAAERRPTRLHERILDSAIELAGAERGYLVLLDRDGRPRVRAGRGIDRAAVAHDDHALSRSIVSRVLGSGRPLSTMDAASDERLSGAASVHALSLRSVIAVPLRLRGEVRGAIYLEDRLRPFAFGEVELSLLGELSDLAGLALESAEALRAERRAARRESVLRARLARRVEAQAIELDSLKRASAQELGGFAGIVAQSAAMRQVLALVRKVAPSDVPVLVRGESGTGKELVARALHGQSPRASRPFVSENCGAIPETLLESTLFGHVRGAFTGADRKRQGLFEVADGGTLFLDEIGEMTAAMQARLLRVLQDGEVRPVGGERSRQVDVRVVAATHRDLEAMVAEGSFRQDLYYRLAVVTVELPPLRQRPGDIPALVAHFVDKHGDGQVQVDPRVLAAFGQHPWRGNVRELENEIRRALVLADGRIALEHLSPGLLGDGNEPLDPLDLKAQINQLERRLIRQALDAACGNQTHAAKMLGVSRYGLQKMLRRLGLSVMH